MNVDLLDLLRKQEIVHPTRITAVEVAHQQLRITISGHPWWITGERPDEGSIVLTFSGIREGHFDAQSLLDLQGDEALETLRITELSKLGWAESRSSDAIYCYGPLTDALRLYANIEDYLWSIDAPRSARDYLNMPDGLLIRFCELTKAQLYLVGNTPRHLTNIIVAELQRQNVNFSINENVRTLHGGIYVQLEGSRFVCDSARAKV